MSHNGLTALQTSGFDKLRQHGVFEQAKTYAYDYLDVLKDWPVFPTEATRKALAAFDEPLSQNMCPAWEVVRLLHAHGSPATVAQTSERYFGCVNGGALPAAFAAKWLADVWDQNTAAGSCRLGCAGRWTV